MVYYGLIGGTSFEEANQITTSSQLDKYVPAKEYPVNRYFLNCDTGDNEAKTTNTY